MSKKEEDAYRLYNIGVANEALGYAAEDPKSAMKFLDEAAINYGKAVDDKPSEKVFSGAPEADRDRDCSLSKAGRDKKCSSARSSAATRDGGGPRADRETHLRPVEEHASEERNRCGWFADRHFAWDRGDACADRWSGDRDGEERDRRRHDRADGAQCESREFRSDFSGAAEANRRRGEPNDRERDEGAGGKREMKSMPRNRALGWRCWQPLSAPVPARRMNAAVRVRIWWCRRSSA